MFKIESYITPILLSYVDKYIKNFRPEDSQVSLWGGDASFHNLDLRLEVLEQELQLPFSFVSGHIHELLIHVPWTKLASEPITITINTIECILKLRGPESENVSHENVNAAISDKAKKHHIHKKQHIEAPPGYVQSLVNKIVSNIRIFCNNLILKYVEEDIVLSMNVKLLTFQSANENWKAAYTETGQGLVTLRKIINIHDLTVCLDKRNASGKIDVYQEPMLYRCSMVIHLLRTYHSTTAKTTSVTRVDLYCTQMEFSMTEQQIPMLIRLIHLVLALHRKELKSESDIKHNVPFTSNPELDTFNSGQDYPITWAGWAWSLLPAVTGWHEEWDKQQEVADSGHTFQFGMYVDDASLTFKVSEASNERSGYYTQRKLKYYPLLTLKLQGIFADSVVHGKNWFHGSSGISEALLIPVGCCSCSQNDVEENGATVKYLKAGSSSQLHKSDSLFDAQAPENKGERKHYNVSWEHHMDTTSEAVLLERTPAIAIDYVYQLIIPDDMTSEQLSELGSDLEYSNLSERALLRLIVGPTRVRLCSGLMHRVASLQAAASAYDYQPYGAPLPPHLERTLADLPPAAEDDYDALNEHIPMRTTRLTVLAPVVELQLMDHGWFEPTKGMLFRRRKKSTGSAAASTPTPPTPEVLLPKLTVECQCIDIRHTAPMYVNRLVHTVCQLPAPPAHMFGACYAETAVRLIGAYCRLILAANRHTYVVTPSSASYTVRTLMKERFWCAPDVVHEEVVFESECVTLTGTYPKLMIIMIILDKFLKRDTEDSLNIVKSSSLIEDATRDFGMVYLEVCVEGIRLKNVKTISTVTIDASLGSVKAFIFDPIEFYCGPTSRSCSDITMRKLDSFSRSNPSLYSTREIQQVLFISGPEAVYDSRSRSNSNENNTDTQLFSATLQYPKNPDYQPHPPIVFFNLQEVCVCIDPLLCRFLLYSPRNLPPKTEVFYLYDTNPQRKISRSASDISASLSETPRKLKTPHESIHSSSEPQTNFTFPPKIEQGSTENISIDVQEKFYNFLKEWFDVWKGLLLYGDISKCTIYFPVKTLSAVGSKGIQEAVQVQMTKEDPPDILVFTLPAAVIRSSTLKHSLSQYIVALPVKVPEAVWNHSKFTFPWTVSIAGLSCFTYQHGIKLNCLKPVTLTATVGLSTSNGKQRPTAQPSLPPRVFDDVTMTANVGVSTAAAAAAAAGTSPTFAHEMPPEFMLGEVPLGAGGVMGQTLEGLERGIGSLGVCVHVDMTPVVLSTSEIQVCLIASILHGLVDILANILPVLPSSQPNHPTVPPHTTQPPPNTTTRYHSTTASATPGAANSSSHGGNETLQLLLKEESTLRSASSTTTTTRTGTGQAAQQLDRVEGEAVGGGGGGVGEMKLTAWLQWTVARFTVQLYAHDSRDVHASKDFTYTNVPKLKLVLDAEDIVSSVDFQSVFLKVKSKIGAASILHFVRDKPKRPWKPGPFLGIIMRTREDTAVTERREDTNFANITITRASCNHTHNLWGTAKKPKSKPSPADGVTLPTTATKTTTNTTTTTTTAPPPSRYITEIVVRMQPIDLLLSPTTLRSYYMVLEPLLHVPSLPPTTHTKSHIAANVGKSVHQQRGAVGGPGGASGGGGSVMQGAGGGGAVANVTAADTIWTNRSLPLAYLECGGFRVTVPAHHHQATGSPPTGNGGAAKACGGAPAAAQPPHLLHDTCIFQVEAVTLAPQAVNPICRVHLRPDLYHRAAQMRVLNVPGSDLEDRQYQLDVTGISLHTGKWSEFSPILDVTESKGSKLKTMSENPALEWNSLGKNRLGNVPHLKLWPVISKFDLSIVAAPAMVYKKDIICGHSIEWNFVSDIIFTLSLSQIKLASALLYECSYVFDMIFSGQTSTERPKVIIPYPKAETILNEFSEERELDCIEFTRDSGFETSDLKSTFSLRTKDSNRIRKVSESDHSSILTKPQTSSSFQPLSIPLAMPFDVLITAGNFSFILYDYEHPEHAGKDVKFSKKHSAPRMKHVDAEKGYEASEEGSVIDERIDAKKFKPLLYISLQQPNAFLSQLQLGEKTRISVFDVRIKVSGPEYVLAKGIPTESDFPIHLLETRPGEPNLDTGILPAFFTLKWSKGLAKAPTLDLEIAKPTRVLCSMSRWTYLLCTYEQILDSYRAANVTNREIIYANTNFDAPFVPYQSARENYSKFTEIKKQFHGVSVFNVKLAQVMFTFKSSKDLELNLSVGRLVDTVTITNRPEKLTMVVHLDCVTVGIKKDKFRHLLLNPWSVSFEVCMFWEPWQSGDSEPQLQVSADSDSIMLDINPDHIKCLLVVLDEVRDFTQSLSNNGDGKGTTAAPKPNDNPDSDDEDVKGGRVHEEHPVHEKEQHYKDDLRAGAFQFVDASGGGLDELPLPYQVMFWTRTVSAMAWRYPQPRALTKVRVFPVPFKLSTTSTSATALGDDAADAAESAQQQQQPQVLCNLEYWSDCHAAYQPYAHFQLSESEMTALELPKYRPHPAVACVWRVVLTNPYGYARVLVSPRALAGCIRVDSYFNKHLVPNLTVAMNISTIQISLYNHFNKDVDVQLPQCLHNYTLDAVIPESQCFMTIVVDNAVAFLATWNFKTVIVDISSSIKCNVLDYMFLSELPLLEPFTSRLELSYSKCLGINLVSKPIQVKIGAAIAHTLAVSAQMWEESWRISEDNKTAEPVNIIIMTHYVVCNDTNLNLRFGQAGHEDIFLPSRCCHLYSWRSQKYKQMLRIALEELRWIWSEPFRIDTDGTEMIHIPDERLTIVVTVKSLSATQKQVIFSGQLIVCNTLLEHFELKVLEAVEKDKEKIFKSSQSYIVGGKTTPPSILIDEKKKYLLRLRFFGLEAAWTGDIPLMENTKCAQPWLVKVPLQERGQFLSIWCRVVVQQFPKGTKILAMLWPLFMVRSNLPVSARVHIETPTLNVHLESTVKGRGEIQQLYCPGTIDHSHQLTFQLDSVTPTSNPYVPLNYSLVDQNNFFKKQEKEDINEILVSIAQYEKSAWPYFSEDDSRVEYVVEDQPLTQVQVRYQNACQYSSALLVELLPWCLLVNTLGCTIALIVNEKELCRISHKGILAPPKLDETFYLGVGIGGTWNLSLPLQVAKSDWGQSFYMPKISGTIPLEGCIKTGVKCGSYICMVSINSAIVNEIRLLKISSTHVLTSHLNLQVQVVCIAVPESDRNLEVPKHLEKHSVTISPNLDKSNCGVSIIQWLTIGNVEVTADYALYMSFSTGDKYGWSCPVRVDKNFARTNFVVKTNNRIVPLILISQESKGQYFLSVHHDVYPQLQIENNSGIKLFCAQMTFEKENKTIISDCVHFNWICSIEDCSSMYYTMPFISEKFPEIPQNLGNVENFVLATDPEGDPTGYLWSNAISISNFNDQFIRIPYYGDIKVSVINAIHTIRIVIQSVSQAEISARDIRVRLSLHESEPFDYKPQLGNIKDSDSDSTIGSSYFSAEESAANRPNNANVRLPTVLEQYAPSSPRTLTSEDSLTEQHIECGVIQRHQNHHRDKVRHVTNIVASSEDDAPCDGGSALRLLLFVKRLTVTLTSDLEDGGVERTEVASVTCDNIGVTATKGDLTEVCVTLSELQVDNQMHSRGSYDFPVVLIGQKAKTNLELKSLNVPIMQLILEAQQHALMKIELNVENWMDYILQKSITDVREVHVTVHPLATYIEDTFAYKLRAHLLQLQPSKLVLWPPRSSSNTTATTAAPADCAAGLCYNKARERRSSSCCSGSSSGGAASALPPHQLVDVSEAVQWGAAVVARPLVLTTFTIEPVAVLLSMHSSGAMYIALDHSPLSFGRFGKRRVVTTPYRLGHALTYHYLSGALFGAGWVVGSLELLGSPGGLARAMGSGLRDFVTYPYHGIVQGPWAFLKGVTNGSASLMRHVTAGTLQSVTKLASSVARNLDRLTLDEEHLRRTEEQRRQRPQGLAQGLMQGLTGLGISLLGAVGGIAHHPLQSLLSQDGASPRSLAAGLGLGLVGVFTKPLSGAAELVALTGEGLLQGAGWNTLPEPRCNPVMHHMFSGCNSAVKYQWKFLQALALASHSSAILFVTDATSFTTSSSSATSGGGGGYSAVCLILTRDALVLVNVDEDVTERVFSLAEVGGVEGGGDPTLLCLRLQAAQVQQQQHGGGKVERDKEQKSGGAKGKGNEDKLAAEEVEMDIVVEMDQACRERVADYVRTTVGLMHQSQSQQQHASAGEHSEMSISPDEGSPQRTSTAIRTEDVASGAGRPPTTVLSFYVNPQSRNYFLCMLALAKQQMLDNTFPVL